MRQAPAPPPIKPRTGIVGIERSIQEKQKATDESISQAFQDLNLLMAKTKEMVTIARNISEKIREKQGNITEDETVQFKSYLMSLGIDDPVTRESSKSSSQYYRNLAKQICDIIIEFVIESNGMVTLPVVYCRVNRARGLELISPDDLLRACQVMSGLDLPLKLRQLNKNLLVLQLTDFSDEVLAKETAQWVKEKGSLTAAVLARDKKIPYAIAQERLLVAEQHELIVRDESSSGVSYYWNLFLYPDEDYIIPYLY